MVVYLQRSRVAESLEVHIVFVSSLSVLLNEDMEIHLFSIRLNQVQ